MAGPFSNAGKQLKDESMRLLSHGSAEMGQALFSHSNAYVAYGDSQRRPKFSSEPDGPTQSGPEPGPEPGQEQGPVDATDQGQEMSGPEGPEM